MKLKRILLTTCIALTACAALAFDDYKNASTFTVNSAFGSSLDSVSCDQGVAFAGGTIKTSAADGDLYIVARHPDGSAYWTKSIATNGTGINKMVKVIAKEGNLFIAATVYMLLNGVSQPTAYMARLDPATGAVIWGRVINYANATDMAVVGTGASLRPMIVGVGIDPNNVESKKFVALSYNLAGNGVLHFSPQTFDGSEAWSVVALQDSFAFFGYNSVTKAGQLQQLKLDGTLGWNSDLTRGEWEEGKISSCDSADCTDGAAIGFAGTYFKNSQTHFETMRITAQGVVIREGGINRYDLSCACAPKWWKGNLYSALAGMVQNGILYGCLYTGSPATDLTTDLELVNDGTLTPAAVCVDTTGCPHVVENIASPGYAYSYVHVYSPRAGGRSWVWSEQGGYANDAQLNNMGALFIAANTPSGSVKVGNLIRVEPKIAAGEDDYETGFGQLLTVANPGVMNNDFATEGCYASFDNPSSGTFSGNSEGGFTYKPDPGFVSVDYIHYTLYSPYGSAQNIAKITVFPKLQKVELSATQVTGGEGLTGSIKMSAPMPADGVVTIQDNSSAITTPAEQPVPAGFQLVSFPITTSPVGSDKQCTVTVKFRGGVWSVPLTIKAPILKALAINPADIVGGYGFNGSVGFTGKAAVATLVTLSHTGSEITLPPSITVAPGQQIKAFTGTTAVVTHNIQRTISASCNGVTKTVTVTLHS